MLFLQGFLTKHPMVEVELTLSDQYVDLAHQGFEAAIRIGESSGSDSPDLVSRELRRYQLVPCASPGYIQENGVPKTPQDLVGHTCLTYLFSDRTHQHEWVFTQGATTIPVQLKSRIRINDMRALINAAINGQGIVLAAEETLVDALRRGDLVRVLSEYQGAFQAIQSCLQSRSSANGGRQSVRERGCGALHVQPESSVLKSVAQLTELCTALVAPTPSFNPLRKIASRWMA